MVKLTQKLDFSLHLRYLVMQRIFHRVGTERHFLFGVVVNVNGYKNAERPLVSASPRRGILASPSNLYTSAEVELTLWVSRSGYLFQK